MKTYDLIVLGSGGAGYQVAMNAKKEGWNVALVNDGPFGGTCSVRGCIPKKVLAGTAEIVDINRRLGEIGIEKKQPEMSWHELINFKRTFTDPVLERTEKTLRDAGIDVYVGAPRFTGNLKLEVAGEELEGKKVHIAVGAKPAKLPIDGFDNMLTSDDFLELDNLPQRLVFVGGGYVSFEFAHIAKRFGAEVTILHGGDQPLPIFDKDIIDELLKATREIGIKVELGARVEKIEKKGEGFVVRTEEGSEFEAGAVIHGAGRPPAISDLELEKTGVEYDKKLGIAVNEFLQSTSNKDVYAAGDCAASGPPLSPVSRVQGAIVSENILGGAKKVPSYHSTPSVIFTTPAVAMVGYQEKQAEENGVEFEVRETDLTEWFDSKRLGLKFAKSKILVEKGSEKIIGAHLICNHAEDLINIFALAIELRLTTEQIKKPIFAFPTASGDMTSMF
jgi:glutathione reductase (NADPH)